MNKFAEGEVVEPPEITFDALKVTIADTITAVAAIPQLVAEIQAMREDIAALQYDVHSAWTQSRETNNVVADLGATIVRVKESVDTLISVF